MPRDLSAVYPRFITGTASALRWWLLTSVRTPICLSKPFSCKACPGTCRIQNTDILRAGRVGAPDGAAGRSRTKLGADRNYSPKKQRSPVPPKASIKRRFNVFPEARTSEILCKPTEEQNQRLTRGLPAVDNRFISGTRTAFCPGCRPVERRLFVSLNSSHARHVRGKPMEELKPRFIAVSSAVYHRNETRSSCLAADQCTDAYLLL